MTRGRLGDATVPRHRGGLGYRAGRRAPIRADGAAVVLVDISSEVTRVAGTIADETERPVRGFVADAADATAMETVLDAVAAELGDVSILVNSAWAGGGESVLGMSGSQWDETLRGTLTSAFVCVRGVLPGMIGARSGRDREPLVGERRTVWRS